MFFTPNTDLNLLPENSPSVKDVISIIETQQNIVNKMSTSEVEILGSNLNEMNAIFYLEDLYKNLRLYEHYNKAYRESVENMQEIQRKKSLEDIERLKSEIDNIEGTEEDVKDMKEKYKKLLDLKTNFIKNL